MGDYAKGKVLRCGRCWRNLETEWGQKLHVIFGDGSMRCHAPEGRSALGEEHTVALQFTSTRVVHDTPERAEALSTVVNHRG